MTDLHCHLINGLDVTTWPTGPPPAVGQFQRYPGRFLYHLTRSNYFKDNPVVFEMFCGQSQLKDMGYNVFTTDIRAETGADLVTPYDALPNHLAGKFDLALVDPPYNKGFSSEWTSHDKDLPKPKRILREAVKVVRPGGLILILHVIVIPAYKVYNVERLALHPILTGPNNAIRVLNVLRKKGLV